MKPNLQQRSCFCSSVRVNCFIARTNFFTLADGNQESYRWFFLWQQTRYVARFQHITFGNNFVFYCISSFLQTYFYNSLCTMDERCVILLAMSIMIIQVFIFHLKFSLPNISFHHTGTSSFIVSMILHMRLLHLCINYNFWGNHSTVSFKN